MRNPYLCILICAVFFVCSGASAQNAPQASTKPPGRTPVNTITISAFEDSVKAGKSIYVVVYLTNATNHEIAFQRLLTGAECKIDVRDAQGNLPAETGRGYLHNGHKANSEWDETRFSPSDLDDNGVGEMVKAGQAITWPINVTKFYEMASPGKYSVRLECGDPEDPTIVLKSNTITITITPN
ncbi:MAG TPA: hypothetical protein VK709_17480 [Candidatus Saccharimonadales bacterium]|nr:hypothetical protein [Candidatus Saccharimonadales bacterium]